jgi:hypothetical protein
MWTVIIVGVILFVIIKFIADSNKVSNQNTQNGGLINKHKSFADYCDNPLSTFRMELVKNTGSILEYRLPIKNDYGLKGYIHFGIEDKFTVVVFCSAVSANGSRHKGFMREVKNWQTMDSDDYNQIFESMMSAMTSSDDFAKLDL